MTPFSEILRLKAMGRTNVQIASEVGCSRQTVVTTLKLAKQYSVDLSSGLDDREIYRIFHGKGENYAVPNLAAVRYALGFGRASRLTLYTEYAEKCRRSGQKAYSRAQFYNMIGNVPTPSDSELRITAALVPTMPKSKEFALLYRVGTSNYLMAAPIMVTTPRLWVHAHNRLLTRLPTPSSFCFIGRLPKALNAATVSMAEHYGFAPTFRRMTESEKAEIGNLSALLGKEIKEEVLQSVIGRMNEKPVSPDQPKLSIESAWAIESKAKGQCDKEPFDLLEILHPAVQSNFHVEIGGRFYSVPFDRRHEVIDAHVRDNTVTLYSGDELIAEHCITPVGGRTRYSTLPDHVPRDSEIPNSETSGRSLRRWANFIGPETYKLVDSILRSGRFEPFFIGLTEMPVRRRRLKPPVRRNCMLEAD